MNFENEEETELTLEGLYSQIEQAEYGNLKPHIKRGGLIWIDKELDLAQIGYMIAKDHKKAIEYYVNEKKLGQPTPEQIEAWDEAKGLVFDFIIVQPFVIAKVNPMMNKVQ